MSSKSISVLIVLAAIILVGGVAVWHKTTKTPDIAMINEATEEGAEMASDVLETNNGDSLATATTTPNGTSTPGSVLGESTCVRSFDAEKLKTAVVDTKNRQVVIDVKDFGAITVELYNQDAPKTVENFLRLVNAGYYNCLTFHRVAKNFVIQGGDPTGTGSGGDSAFGGDFPDELNQNTPSYKAGYKKGVLAMANRGANTNTSQFFIVLADVPLPHNYTIFGKVSVGQEVVDKIGMVDITPGPFGSTDGKPVQPVVMQSVIIK